MPKSAGCRPPRARLGLGSLEGRPQPRRLRCCAASLRRATSRAASGPQAPSMLLAGSAAARRRHRRPRRWRPRATGSESGGGPGGRPRRIRRFSTPALRRLVRPAVAHLELDQLLDLELWRPHHSRRRGGLQPPHLNFLHWQFSYPALFRACSFLRPSQTLSEVSDGANTRLSPQQPYRQAPPGRPICSPSRAHSALNPTPEPAPTGPIPTGQLHGLPPAGGPPQKCPPKIPVFCIACFDLSAHQKCAEPLV